MAAEGEEQIAISVVDRDRVAGSEAVGAREMDVGGDLPRSRKGAVFVIEVSYIVVGVILTAWLALPDASLGGVERDPYREGWRRRSWCRRGRTFIRAGIGGRCTLRFHNWPGTA